MTRREKSSKQKEFPFSAVLNNSEATENLKGWTVRSKIELEPWHGEFLLPPNTLLYHAVEAFRLGTDIPLELPFITTLHFIAGLLLTRNVKLKVDSTTVVDPTIWCVVLCESGGGKSTVLVFLRKAFNCESIEIPLEGVTGSRSFFDGVLKRPRGLWVNDEFGQRIRTLSDPKNADWKALVLRVGTGDDLVYSTGKEGEMAVRQPRISLLGLTQTELWTRHIPPESLLDGLCARFNFVIAKEDNARPPQLFPRYHFAGEKLGKLWNELNQKLLKEYILSDEALAHYDNYFRTNWPNDLPRGFARRIMFSAHRYALLYHVISDPEQPMVSAADYIYAMRLVCLFLHDGRDLIGEHKLNETDRIMKAAERACERFLAKGKPFGIRDLISSVRAIPNVVIAEAVWRNLWPKAKDRIIYPSEENL